MTHHVLGNHRNEVIVDKGISPVPREEDEMDCQVGHRTEPRWKHNLPLGAVGDTQQRDDTHSSACRQLREVHDQLLLQPEA